MKIRTRLSLAFLLLVSIGFYLLVRWVVHDLRPRYLETMEDSMVETSTLLSAFVAADIRDGAMDVSNLRQSFDSARRRRFSARIYEVTKTRIDMRVYVTDTNGLVVFDSDGGRDEGRDYSRWNDVVRTLRMEYGARASWSDPKDPTSETLYVAAPILADGRVAGALTVCKPAGSVMIFIRTAKDKIALAGAVAAAAVILFGMIASVWITRPIQRLIAHAHAVRDGRRPPAPALGRGELGTLATAFEEMRDALEGKQYVEGYVQALTHEMKGPLSAVRGAAELLGEDMPAAERERFLGNIRAETARMQELIDRLLQLSALESRKELRDVESIPLPALIQDIRSSFQPVAARKKVRLDDSRVQNIAVRGERFLIRQAVSNLLQNAIDFSPDQGTIVIAATAAGRQAEMVITDEGGGIPNYALPRVFERFYSLRRPDTGKKSSGLGLAVVREIALLHGGDARIENWPEGGVRATLILPLSPPEP